MNAVARSRWTSKGLVVLAAVAGLMTGGRISWVAVPAYGLAQKSGTVWFATKSEACRYHWRNRHEVLRCDVVALHPPPSSGIHCSASQTAVWHSIVMHRGRPAHIACKTDYLFRPEEPPIKHWRRGSFSCTAVEIGPGSDGIRCRTTGGHGFFLSPSRWHIH